MMQKCFSRPQMGVKYDLTKDYKKPCFFHPVFQKLRSLFKFDHYPPETATSNGAPGFYVSPLRPPTQFLGEVYKNL